MQEYYKNGYINCPDSQSVLELRETCDYFMIPFSEKTVKTNNLSMYSIYHNTYMYNIRMYNVYHLIMPEKFYNYVNIFII